MLRLSFEDKVAIRRGEQLQNSIFVVNEEPYCIWEVSLSERNNEFLEGIDTGYFDYAVKVHLDADDEKRASIALRATLHHAEETLFSLLGAYIQAPDCAYAWIAKCSNNDLRDFVNKVSNLSNSLFTKLNIERVSWEAVANSVFAYYMPESEKRKQTVDLFASLWQRLAYEYTDQNNVDEYNSLKHGFRVRSGGFSMVVGLEPEYGVPPPQEETRLVGSSEFGTTFFKIEPVKQKKGDRNIRSRKISINWEVEKVILLIQLVSMSIHNVTSALRIVNGAKAGTCMFLRPQEDSDFEMPWQYTPKVSNLKMTFILNEDLIPEAPKTKLMGMLNERKQNQQGCQPEHR